MKYCISGRQSKMILAQADEIKFQYKDRERILDYIDGYSNKTFIIDIPKEEEIDDWDFLNMLNEKTNIILSIRDLKNIKEHNFKFYWAYPITTWYELQGIAALYPSYLFLEAPLSFELEKVKSQFDIPIRLNANLTYDAYIPRENGIYGTWVRPEDIEIYEKWVDVIEFLSDDLSKEATLFHVYKDQKTWPGNLNLLLTNLNYNIDNRAIPVEIGKIRANCGQRCMSGGACNFCSTAFKFAKDVRKLYYQRKKLN